MRPYSDITQGIKTCLKRSGTAGYQIFTLLPKKNEQLAIQNHERIVLIVRSGRLVDPADLVAASAKLEACEETDSCRLRNIDRIFLKINRGNLSQFSRRQRNITDSD